MRRSLILLFGAIVTFNPVNSESWSGLDEEHSNQEPTTSATQETETAASASAEPAMAMVVDGIERWSSVSGIRVSPEAEKEVTSQVLMAFPEESKSHLERATRAYLYEVRDRLRYAGQYPSEITAPNLIIQFTESAAAKPYRKPRGFVSVTSEPKGASVSVDRDGKGYTNTEIVMSPGRHVVRVEDGVRSCLKIVEVLADKTEHVHADFGRGRARGQCK